jgi:hypothetical protein
LVDTRLLEQVAPVMVSLRGSAGKHMVAGSPSISVPAEVLERAKTGFTTPIEHWLEREDRVQAWRRVPLLAQRRCPWGRRWAYQLATA